ncbi:MAG: glycosyltransferase family 9 protein [Acidobacteriia bacterium]|nr:glycosyltransferase family 9 protein [Terriglobia bacterium]
MAEKNFLVLRLGSLGDIVHTFPAVAGLRASFPGSGIVWLTSERWRTLVERSGLADTIWTVDTRRLSSIRETLRRVRSQRDSWAASIDYQGLWKSALFPFLGGVHRRIGFAPGVVREFGVPLLYTDRVRTKAEHVADQNSELTLRAGAFQAVAPFTLRVLDEEVAAWNQERTRAGIERYCVLAPGGGWQSKCWPAVRFGALCRRIRDDLGLRCVVNYGPGEESLAEIVRAASGNSEPLLNTNSLGGLMAMLRNAALVVGGDTGPLHLAVALGAPVVGLYGPTNPARNGPYSKTDIALRVAGVATTHRRESATHPAILALSVEEVFAAVTRRLEAAR